MDAGIHDRLRGVTIAAFVAVLAAAVLVTFSPGTAGAAEPTSSVAADAVGAPILWGVCDPPGVDLQCARIVVPLDWKDPGGRTISLAVIRHLASKPQELVGTLFINPGGPGDTGIGLLQGDPKGIDARRRQFRRCQLGSSWYECQHAGAVLS